MSSKTVSEGYWWSPEEPNSKLAGELIRSSKSGLLLRLRIPVQAAPHSTSSLKVVHGSDEHGKPITLFYCMWAGSSSTGAAATATYEPGYAFYGEHLNRWADAAFDESRVSFTALEAWVNISGFGRAKGEGMNIEYMRPEELSFKTGQGFRLVLAATAQHKHRRDFQSIAEGWGLRLEYNQPTAFRTIRKHLQKTKQFLMLATRRAEFQTEFFVSKKAHSIRLGRHLIPQEIVCVTPSSKRTRRNSESLRSHDLLFTFKDIQADFARILPDWFKYSVTFTDALNLYFSCIENKHLYGNHQILFLAQALEVYHRTHTTKYKQAVESKQEFRARCKRLCVGLELNDANWLKEKLAWANQPTLHERLLDIFADKRSLLGDFLGDEDAFARRIRDLRNYYTHYAAKKGKRNQEDHPKDALELCHKLKAILQVCFLSDIGIPDTSIKKVVKKIDWNVVNFTETDDEEPPQAPVSGLPLLKARAKSNGRSKPKRTKKA